MSIKTQITRLENAKVDILSAITEKGVTVPGGVLLEDVADLIRQITDKYLTAETDDGTSGHLLIEIDGETTDQYLSVTFN